MRNQRGITLIALVITIIVLLILAGVSIAMLTGENGILTRSTQAVAENNIAEDKEAATLDLSAAYTDYMDAKYVGTDDEDIITTDFVQFLYSSGLTGSGASNTSGYLTDTAHYTVEVTGSSAADAEITITTVNVNSDETPRTETATVSGDGGFVETAGKAWEPTE